MSIAVIRDNHRYDVEHEEFWNWVKAGSLLLTDVIECRDGEFRPATQVSNLQVYLPKPKSDPVVDFLTALAVGVGTAVAVGGAIALVSELLKSKPSKRRYINVEPLTDGHRTDVRERDGAVCQYCGAHSPNGHVDHKNPRVLGGSNLMRNLAWTCPSCNLRKGSMTAEQFRRKLEREDDRN